MHYYEDLKIIYQAEVPYGIRDVDGFLLFFPSITEYPGQKIRVDEEIAALKALADYLFEMLQQRGLQE